MRRVDDPAYEAHLLACAARDAADTCDPVDRCGHEWDHRVCVLSRGHAGRWHHDLIAAWPAHNTPDTCDPSPCAHAGAEPVDESRVAVAERVTAMLERWTAEDEAGGEDPEVDVEPLRLRDPDAWLRAYCERETATDAPPVHGLTGAAAPVDVRLVGADAGAIAYLTAAVARLTAERDDARELQRRDEAARIEAEAAVEGAAALRDSLMESCNVLQGKLDACVAERDTARADAVEVLRQSHLAAAALADELAGLRGLLAGNLTSGRTGARRAVLAARALCDVRDHRGRDACDEALRALARDDGPGEVERFDAGLPCEGRR